MSREWKKVRKFVLFFFFLYNNKSYIFGDLNYVKIGTLKITIEFIFIGY